MDALRVAVALIALEHKLPHQSIPSCVLDLQAAFSVAEPYQAVTNHLKSSTDTSPEISSSAPYADTDRAAAAAWRAHALQLESEAATLRAQLQAERVKNLVLAEAAPEKTPAWRLPQHAQEVSRSAAATPAPAPAPSPLEAEGSGSIPPGGGAAAPPKKKLKKKAQASANTPANVSATSNPASAGSARDAASGRAPPASTTTAQSDALTAVMRYLAEHQPSAAPMEELTLRASPMVATDRLFQLAALFQAPASNPGSLVDQSQPVSGKDDHEPERAGLLAACCAAAIEAVGLELGSVVASASANVVEPGGGGSGPGTKYNGTKGKPANGSKSSRQSESIATRSFGVYAIVLEQIVVTVLPLLARPVERTSTSGTGGELLDRTLGTLSKKILVPCLRSFAPLSVSFMAGLLKEGLGSANTPDLRPSILSLLRTVFTALFSASSSDLLSAAQSSLALASLRTTLVLDTLTELDTTLFPEGCSQEDADSNSILKSIWDSSTYHHHRPNTNMNTGRGSAGASPSPPSRLNSSSSTSDSSGAPQQQCNHHAQTLVGQLQIYERHLAKKDGLWYLCSVLHLLSSFDGTRPAPKPASPSPSPPDSDRPLLRSSSEHALPGAGLHWDSDLTYERMRKAIIADTLALLSRAAEGVRLRTTPPTDCPNRVLDRSSSNSVDASRSSEDTTPGASVTGTDSGNDPVTQSQAAPVTPREAGTASPKATLPASSSAAIAHEGVKRSGGGCCCSRLDEAVYTMVLGAAERVLLAYGG